MTIRRSAVCSTVTEITNETALSLTVTREMVATANGLEAARVTRRSLPSSLCGDFIA